MSDKSIFSKQWKLISSDPSELNPSELKELSQINQVRLKPLQLKTPWYVQFKKQIQMGLTLAVSCSFALWLFTNNQEHLTAKGSVMVNVIWERQGKVQSISSESALQDGDKIGASVVASQDSFAYWVITDNQNKVISDLGDIESSKITLQAGVSKSFESSFTLTAPNQGENLVVVICPQEKMLQPKQAMDSVFSQQFFVQLMSEQKINSSNCMFAGYRLRSLK